MQPPSRRDNRFCIATSSLYSLNELRELDDYGELERLWYKADKRQKLFEQARDVDNRKNGKDRSRYSGFNLEPLLRNGSANIEIRYHSPTLNDEKILRWVDLHQTIFDFVAKLEIDDQGIDAILTKETHLIRKAKAMCQMFGIKKDTQDWIISRLHKFNKIELRDDEMEDEEVDRSEVGSPSHGGGTRPSMRRRSGMSSQRPPLDISEFSYTMPTGFPPLPEELSSSNIGQVIRNLQDFGNTDPFGPNVP